jgi:hypothetical protein
MVERLLVETLGSSASAAGRLDGAPGEEIVRLSCRNRRARS